jgi:hypothetical protein
MFLIASPRPPPEPDASRGISTAIEARVDEMILYLQRGHGAALPARAYMQLASPPRFLETLEAFGL